MMAVKRLQDRGQSEYEGLREVVLDVLYIWRQVGPFTFGYALAMSDTSVLTMKPIDSTGLAPSFYHRLDLYTTDERKEISAVQLPRTDAKYPDALLTFNASTFLLAPRAYTNPGAALVQQDDRVAVETLHAFVNAPPDMPTGNPGLRELAVTQVRRLSTIDAAWVGVERDEPAIGWLYLATPLGVFRRYPV
jgi:hypothetical protein